MAAKLGSPSLEVESEEDDGEDNDVADGIGSVPGEASLDKFVVVEGVEEVDALVEDEGEEAEAKVAGGRGQEYAVVAHYLAKTELLPSQLTL